MAILIGIILILCLFSGLGAWIADQKHRDQAEGLLLGLLFGPLGCLIEAMLPTLEPGGRKRGVVERMEAALNKTFVDPDWRDRGHSGMSRPTVEETPQAREWRETEARLMAAQAERRAAQDRERLFLEAERSREEWKRIHEWFDRVIWRFGWFRALPEPLQPILVGLIVAAPIVTAIVVAFR